MSLDLLTVGRVSVDLYPQQSHVGFDGAQSFVKSIGGSPTNVAVAGARLGLRTAAVTKVGDDGLGRFVCRRLRHHGVDTRYVSVEPGAQTPLAIVALDPPERPQVAFYRGADAPDTRLVVEDVAAEEVRSARAFWASHGALAQGSTSTTLRTWLHMRDRAELTILDLDYRPALWDCEARARESAAEAISLSDVVVGNRAECAMALGETDPRRVVDALLTAGVRLAVVKHGGDGVLLATPEARLRLPARPVEVVCGLGAGDAFGGALVYGLLAGWDLGRIGALASAAGAHVAGRLTCSDDMPQLGDLTADLERELG